MIEDSNAALWLTDKKNLKEKLQLVLPMGAGQSKLQVWNDDKSILKLLEDFGAGK